MNSNKSIAVEFLGLPGSGKTLLCHRVAILLSDKKARVDEPSQLFCGCTRCKRVLRKSIKIARELILHPCYCLRSASAILRVRHKSTSDLFRVLLNWFVVSSFIRRGKSERGIHLHDQGILQALWSIAFSSDGTAIHTVASRLRDLMPTPSLVVVVEVKLSTAARRLSSRAIPNSRVEGRNLSEQPLLRSAALFEETRNLLDTLCTEETGTHSLLLQNDDDNKLEANAAEVARALEQLAGGTPSAPLPQLIRQSS